MPEQLNTRTSKLKKKSKPKLIWIEAFVAINDHGSVSNAAIHLKCHQSTVTRHLDDLQNWLGRVLLHPNMFPPKLLPDGVTFLPIAREILGMIEGFRTGIPTDQSTD